MSEYINRGIFVAFERGLHCQHCTRRQGKKNGIISMVYDIGDAPCRSCGIDDMISAVENFPASDVYPIIHAEWKTEVIPDAYGEIHLFACSRCGSESVHKQNYCRDCGAKMDLKGENDTQ